MSLHRYCIDLSELSREERIEAIEKFENISALGINTDEKPYGIVYFNDPQTPEHYREYLGPLVDKLHRIS